MDMAILHRDSAIAERNNAIMERDNAITALQYRENAMNKSNVSPCPPGCQIACGVKHTHHPQQHAHHQSHMVEAQYNTRDMHVTDTVSMSPVALEPAKSYRKNYTKVTKPAMMPTKKMLRSSKKVKHEDKNLKKEMFRKLQEWKSGPDMGSGGDDLNRQLGASKQDWKDHDLGLNQVAFDETTMPVPVCSCTGVLRPCYKWGNGGCQSSYYTMNLSMYPLPAIPNKRHAQASGWKISGSAFNKLFSRLAAEGHDLSNPVDLKDH